MFNAFNTWTTSRETLACQLYTVVKYIRHTFERVDSALITESLVQEHVAKSELLKKAKRLLLAYTCREARKPTEVLSLMQQERPEGLEAFKRSNQKMTGEEFQLAVEVLKGQARG
jgi:ssRNA-specific RNase YbeY (16S rRNA maturation enzyme)